MEKGCCPFKHEADNQKSGECPRGMDGMAQHVGHFRKHDADNQNLNCPRGGGTDNNNTASSSCKPSFEVGNDVNPSETAERFISFVCQKKGGDSSRAFAPGTAALTQYICCHPSITVRKQLLNDALLTAALELVAKPQKGKFATAVAAVALRRPRGEVCPGVTPCGERCVRAHTAACDSGPRICAGKEWAPCGIEVLAQVRAVVVELAMRRRTENHGGSVLDMQQVGQVRAARTGCPRLTIPLRLFPPRRAGDWGKKGSNGAACLG